MNLYTLHALAKHLREPIDLHVELIGSSDVTADKYYQREATSVAARSRAAYLIQYLADDAAAARLARLVGMPAYLDLRQSPRTVSL